MKRTSKLRHLVVYLLVFSLLLGAVPMALAANQSQEIGLQEVPVTAADLQDQTVEVQESDAPAPDESLRVIIVFKDKALVDKGFSTTALSQNSAAMAYRTTLETKQDAQMAVVSKVLGQTLDVEYQFTIGINGVATTVRYDQIEAIEALDVVDYVYIENQYEPDVVEPDTSTAGTMIGSYSAWADGYTGAGSRIAIIDTGLDLDHPSFEEEAFLYSLELSAARFDKDVEDYNLLTAEEVAAILPQLHAAERYAGLTAADLYRSAKVPFAFNYVDESLDVTHDNDSQGDHGTHVSGIAAANKYVWSKDSDGDLVAATQEQGVVGVAPDAQILPMKVFGKSGGAYDSDYMAALEDAILLGCDTVNLSLGSAVPGHTYSNYDELFASLTNTDTVVTISAGNKYSYAYFNNTGVSLNLTDDTVINTVGSPGTFPNSLAVASVTNSGLTGILPSFSGVSVSYGDTYEDYKMNAFVTLDTSEDNSGVEYDYVFLGDPVNGTGIYGAEEDFTGVDLTGKVVLISRGGGVSFFEKANRAVAAGAIATVVYNNAAGSINMNMTGYSYKNPAISIDKAYAEAILAASTQNADGTWTGTMLIANKVQVYQDVLGGYEPSVFSSWGVPGNLDLKPEIIAPGGNIWSTLTDGTYGLMSGTSMSAPSVTGMAAVVAQYVKESGLNEQEGLTVRALSQALLMSTSVPLLEDDTIEYSPRKQGSGLANVYAAVTSPAYLLTDSKDTTDGKVKVTLGDDPERNGVYEFDFTVNNLSDEALRYVFSANINSMAVETYGDEDFMSNTAYALSPDVTFSTTASVDFVYDLNEDGAVDIQDAQALLKVANGTNKTALSDLDVVRYDFDGDGTITTADAKLFLIALDGDTETADVYAQAYLVDANSAISVHVTVTLSDADKAYFAENYANGCYVEGFVYAADPDEQNPELSLPMLAYYGSWTDASMFDKYITLEDYSDPNAYPYTGTSVTNALIVDGYVLTSNPYDSTAAYLADHTAITSSSRISSVYASLIRNAGGDVYVEVSNAETGEVYKTVDAGALYGAYYSTSSGAWANTLQSISLGWNTTDADGNALPEGTKVKVSVYAIPEYNWDRETGTVVGTLGDGASWDTYFTVDDTAPVILDGSYTTNWITGSSKLTIQAQDNRYVAAILVMNARQTEVLARQGVNQTELGAPVEVEVDITGISASDIVVLAVDYAGNATGYEVKLGNEEDTGDVSEYIYINDCFDDAWLSFKPDNYEGAVEVAEGAIYAAEYIDGYVFTVDKDLRFCVAPLENIENQTYIETLNTTSVVLDMAYNYADGKLYALCTNNYLYTIDPLMGTTSQVGIIPLPAGNNLQTLACSTDGTFYGVTNSGSNSYGYSKLYSFTLGEEGFTVKAFPNDTGRSTIYLQSMAFDHNTGKLYHANYGFNSDYTGYEGTLVTYDLETGAATEIANFGTHEMVGMFIPKKSTGIFGPSQEVTEISLSQTEVSMLKGGTVTLEVSAKPWTVVNRDCSWVSSDETVATVKDGVITATGVGTCTIAAASVLNPQAVATCTVTVTAVEKDMTGIIWDEEGAVWFSSFNTNTIPAYTKLNTTACDQPLMALTTDPNGITYAASFETTSSGTLISSLYKVSGDYALTKIGTSEIGYTDLTWCPSLGNDVAVATYGNYVVLVDVATGNYKGAWDFSSSIGSAKLVGVTYYTAQESNTGAMIDYCLLLDSNGNVWLTGFAAVDDSYQRTTPQAITNLGYTTGSYWYYSSIATDGTYLYCSMFNGAQTNLIVLDLNSGAIANVGNFGTEVWPVTGLQVTAANDSADLVANAMEAAALMAPVSAETETIPAIAAEN